MDEIARIRREAVARLCQAQAEGRLSIEAFEERYALLAEAETQAAVQAITAAFDPESGSYDLVPVDPAPLPAYSAEPVRLAAVLGSVVRAGNWNVPEEVHLLVFMGEAKLDLREASWAADVLVIHASITMGSLELTVPPGTQIENDCQLIMASAKHKRPRKATPEPNGLMVIIQGRVIMGEVTVRERDLGEPQTFLQRMGFET